MASLSALVSFLLLGQNSMAKENYKRRNLIWVYGFRGSESMLLEQRHRNL